MTVSKYAAILVLGAMIGAQAGCAVPQPKGHGTVTRRIEPQTKAAYWLYLPEDYVANKGNRPDHSRWPTVVTFHGMRPWDDAEPQIREWQQEADRYGLIVISPELRTCDSFMQYPLQDPELPYVKRDETATLAIMDEVFRETNADPSHVLSTSWSSGGYLAHFMVNKHPERFSCLAVRQSNFSEAMLNPSQVPRYRDMRVGIFFGENDFKACRDESKRAVEWYRQYRFPVQAKYVSGLGHERTPQTAAAFFASSIGVTPKTPPDLGKMVMYDVDDLKSLPGHGSNRPAVASAQPGPAPVAAARSSSSIIFNSATPAPVSPAPIRPPIRVTSSDTVARSPGAGAVPAGNVPTPRRPIRQPYSAGEAPAPRVDKRARPAVPPIRERLDPPPIPGKIELQGGKEGPAPLMLNLRLNVPREFRDGARVLWTDNDRAIAEDFETQRLLSEPGDHHIEVRLVTADDRQLTLRETIRVLPSASTQPSS